MTWLAPAGLFSATDFTDYTDFPGYAFPAISFIFFVPIRDIRVIRGDKMMTHRGTPGISVICVIRGTKWFQC